MLIKPKKFWRAAKINKIHQIYRQLYKTYGPQGWWPVTPEGKELPEYFTSLKTGKQQFEVCAGAILTQNTSWKNVEKAIINLNKNRLMDIKKILEIKKEKLAEIIKSSGYYNQKAKKLKNFSLFLIKEHNGNINEFFNKNIKILRDELLSIKGVGPETADSIILYAAQKPIFVIDAYTKRIMNRIGFKEETYEQLQNLFTKNLNSNAKLFNEYHALIVELGKNTCKKKPLCAKCPIRRHCSHKQ